jgi:capsular polysaccharide transport system permease protein
MTDMTQIPSLLRRLSETGETVSVRPSPMRALLRRLGPWRNFTLIVLLPTLLASVYLFGIAANQYQSEASFVVRSNSLSTTAAASGSTLLNSLSGMGSQSGVASSTGLPEQLTLQNYMMSHDAVTALAAKMDLVGMFRRPWLDVLLRLWYANPNDVELLRYFRWHVDVVLDTETGVSNLTVRAFDPEDARKIAAGLLELGEQRINEYNERADEESLLVAKEQVARTEDRVKKAQANLTAYRLQVREIDPAQTSQTVLGVISGLESQLAQTRSQIAGMKSFARPDSPQYRTLMERQQALEQQIADQSVRLTGKNGALAPVLSRYEELSLERDFANQDYESASSALEQAMSTAIGQHLFVSRVVQPNAPGEAEYPESLLDVATIFMALAISYSIGWLLMVGAREHAA